jgi:hypothetical protein
MKDGGEILVMAPNRRSVWSRMTDTPLGHGRPYTGHQLFDVLASAGFRPLKPIYALYTPPTRYQWLLKMAPTLEHIGALAWRKFGGVVLFPARKEVANLVPLRAVSWGPRIFKPTVIPS